MLVFIVKKLSNTPYANQIEAMQRTMNKPFSKKLRIASLEIKRCIFFFSTNANAKSRNDTQMQAGLLLSNEV